MADVTALIVHFIQVENNFVHMHAKLLSKFQNASSSSGSIILKHGDTSCYTSYCPSPFNGNGENALNISAAFANSISLEEHSTVIISPVKIKSLKYVHVTPLSNDDFEIMENSADIIEKSLLDQIRVVSAHQNITVWVSKSISVVIHVDKLSENNLFGRLENFTEIIVSTEVRPCATCSTESGLKAGPVNSWSLSFLKDVVSVFTSKVYEEPNSETFEMEFSPCGIFRCYSTNVLAFHNVSYISTYPFNVFLSKKYIKNECISTQGVQVCRLKHLSYMSSKYPKEDKPDMQDNSIASSASMQEIYVQVHILENFPSFEPTVEFQKANSYPSIFISETISNNLNCKVNSKLKMDYVKPTRCNVTEVNYSCNDKKIAAEEVKSFFNAYTQIHDSVIINNYCPQNFCGQIVSFSFNPFNIPYIEMCYNDVQKCNFVAVERKIENAVQIEEPSFTSNLLNFSFHSGILREMSASILLELGFQKNYETDNSIANSNHVIIEGDNGCGKSCLVNLLGDKLAKSKFGVFVKIVECKSLKGKLVNKLKTVFECIFRECVHFQPSVIIFDDLDVLFISSKQNDQHHNDKSVSSYTNRLAVILSDLIRSYVAHRVTVIATATNITSFESSLYNARGAPIFSIKKCIPPLDQNMRRESLLQFLSSKYRISIDHLKSECLEDVILRLEGYCVQDISDLVDRIFFEAIKRQVKLSPKIDQVTVNKEDIETAISEIIPVSLKGVDFHKNSSITWKNVGGLDSAKQLLTEILLWPSKYPKIFQQCPLKMPSGVLLYGAPGSGKTLLAGAVAGESSLNFISIKGPELLSKYVGESEEGVRNTFRRAQNAKPCILFFDEFESLAPRRGNDITGVTDRVVNQLLTELDGVESVSGVWVLAATSRPDLIDPALLRPGRLGSMVYCPLPNRDERLSILKVICSSAEIDDDVDLNVIAQVTDGFTGADLQAVFYTAHVKNCQKTQISGEADTKICMQSLIEAVTETKPSLKKEERQNYEQIYQRFSLSDEKIGLELEKQRLTYA